MSRFWATVHPTDSADIRLCNHREELTLAGDVETAAHIGSPHGTECHAHFSIEFTRGAQREAIVCIKMFSKGNNCIISLRNSVCPSSYLYTVKFVICNRYYMMSLCIFEVSFIKSAKNNISILPAPLRFDIEALLEVLGTVAEVFEQFIQTLTGCYRKFESHVIVPYRWLG